MRPIRLRDLRSWLFLAVLVGAASGCATPAQVEQMVPVDVGIPEAPADSPFRGSINLGKVVGGEDPSPDMTYSTVGGQELEKALRASLRSYGYLSPETGARFRLDVALIELRRPRFGFTMEGASFMRYKLVRVRDGETVYDEVIQVSATKTVQDEPVGVARDRMLLEAIVRGNIARFLRTLHDRGADAKIDR